MNIKNYKDLKLAIRELEIKKLVQERELQYHFQQVYEKLKPAHIINTMENEFAITPEMKKSFLNALIGIGVGFISRKILLGKSNNFFKRIFGLAFERSIANVVTNNMEKIKTMGTALKQIFMSKSE